MSLGTDGSSRMATSSVRPSRAHAVCSLALTRFHTVGAPTLNRLPTWYTVRVSAKIDHGLRIAVELAAASAGRMKASTIAERQQLPQRDVERILSDLRLGGIVRSQRGHNGGWRLTRPGREITVADVIRALEGRLLIVRDEPPESLAYPGAAGPLQHVWVGVRATVRSVTEGVTLDHLATGQLPPELLAITSDADVRERR